jgi:hypothetical protein
MYEFIQALFALPTPQILGFLAAFALSIGPLLGVTLALVVWFWPRGGGHP